MGPFHLIQKDEMTPRQREVADSIASGPRGALKGPFLALIHNAELANRVQALGEHLRFGTVLPPPLTEIAILVTARRWTSHYEWAAHARLARQAGVTDTIIEGIGAGSKPADLTPEESLVHDFAWQTVWHGAPDDATLHAVIAHYDRATALDLMALCGYYTMLAFVLNGADLPLPEGAKPLAALIAR